MLADYQALVSGRIESARPTGFDVPVGGLPNMLFDWQQAIVRWATRLGRAAIFAQVGLGKTFMQVAWANAVSRHTGGRVLIICPLAVSHQTIAEAARLGIGVTGVRSRDGADASPSPIVITNYDMAIREGAFDFSRFTAIVLDESSRLKGYTSRTRRFLTEACAGIPFRLCCTATPSPNDTTELGQTAEFLGVMTSGEMLTRWYIRDSQHANELRLKGHAVKHFWQWVATWAVCLNRPSDLGACYSDEGYLLPPLRIHYQEVEADHSRAWSQVDEHGQVSLYLDGNRSATAMWREKRETLPARIRRAAAIVATAPDRPWIIWHETDRERDAIQAAIPEAVIVTGSQQPEEKERLLTDFASGRARILATKPKIGAWGLNLQHCADVVFVGPTHKWEELYQAIGRCHRYGQHQSVNVHLVYAESETGIMENLHQKWEKHEAMHEQMIAAVREHGLQDIRPALGMETAVETDVRRGATWEMRLGDSVLALRELPPDSVHLSLSSWPFSDQYMYSANVYDFGNCQNDDDFARQMAFLLPELLRVTISGRMALVHAKDRTVYGTKNAGFRYIEPFSDRCVEMMARAGWLYYGRITIATDPVHENNQTNSLGYSNLQKDASRIGVGMPEYLLLFRKPHRPTAAGGTWSDEPVELPSGYSLPRWQVDANSLWRSNGRILAPWETGGYDYHAHIEAMEEKDERGELGRANGPLLPTDCPAVWWNVKRFNVLNGRMAREQQDERHVCPLQLDVCERAIVRWSNPGDLVLDYFMGVGSVGVTALQLGRRAIGIELKRSYWEAASRYLEQVGLAATQRSLADLLEVE